MKAVIVLVFLLGTVAATWDGGGGMWVIEEHWTRGAVALLLAAAASGLMLAGRRRAGGGGWRWAGEFLPVIALAAFCALSLAWTRNVNLGLKMNVALLPGLLVMFITASANMAEDMRKRAVSALMASSLLAGAAIFLEQRGALEYFGANMPGNESVSLGHLQLNSFLMIAAIGMPIFLLYSYGTAGRTVMLCVAILSAASVLATSDYRAAFAVAASAGIVTAVRRKAGSKTVWLGATAAVAIFLFIAGRSPVTQLESSNHVPAKWEAWTLGMKVFKSNPVLGAGAGGFEGAMLTRIDAVQEPFFIDLSENLKTPLNSAVHFLAEEGIVGILLFAWMMFAILGSALRKSAETGDAFDSYIAFSLCAMALLSLGDTGIISPSNGVLFFGLAGLAAGRGAAGVESRPGWRQAAVWALVLVLAAGGCWLSFGYATASLRTGKGLVYLAKGDSERAKDSFNSASEADPHYGPAFINGAKVYRNLGNMTSEIEALNKYLAQFPDSGVGNMNLGYIYSKVFMDGEAVSHLTRAAEIINGTVIKANILSVTGRIYMKKYNYASALKCAEEILTIDPMNAAGHYLRGEVYQKWWNQDDQAKQEFIETLRTNPLHLDAYIKISEIFRKQKNITAANRVLDEAFKRNLSNAKLLFEYAIVKMSLGDTEAAKAALKKAIDADPNIKALMAQSPELASLSRQK